MLLILQYHDGSHLKLKKMIITYSTLLLSILTFMQTTTIFDFNKTNKTSGWINVDDVVMGGKSSGKF